MTWDELEDELDCMDMEDMKATIKILKVRFGQNTAAKTFHFFLLLKQISDFYLQVHNNR